MTALVTALGTLPVEIRIAVLLRYQDCVLARIDFPPAPGRPPAAPAVDSQAALERLMRDIEETIAEAEREDLLRAVTVAGKAEARAELDRAKAKRDAMGIRMAGIEIGYLARPPAPEPRVVFSEAPRAICPTVPPCASPEPTAVVSAEPPPPPSRRPPHRRGTAQQIPDSKSLSDCARNGGPLCGMPE